MGLTSWKTAPLDHDRRRFERGDGARWRGAGTCPRPWHLDAQCGQVQVFPQSLRRRAEAVTFTAVGPAVKAAVDLVGTDGSKIHWEYTATLDGKPAAVTGNPDGDMVVAKRTNPNTIETSYTLKGKPTTVNTRVVSADGKTLTVTSTGTNAQGQKVNNHQVFEKS